MLQIRLFRFDPHCDVASYFKPYVYESAPFADLAALLDDICAHDPYFSAQGVEFVKIDSTTVSVKEPLDTLIAHFGSELTIAPLSEKEAIKDLRYEPRVFLDKFQAFAGIVDVSDFEFYKSLAPYFYSTKIPACSQEFLGNSAFIFAHRLMQTHPSERMRILEIIEPQMAYFTKCDAVGMEFDDRAAYRAFCDILKFEPARSNKILSAQSMAEFDAAGAKHDFSGFNIAVWYDEAAEELASRLGAQILHFGCEGAPLGAQIYERERECALRLGGEILFDAFDSGSDFLLVNSKLALDFLDGRSDEIQRLFGRGLAGFYLIATDELIALARGERPDFSARKLKPTLI